MNVVGTFLILGGLGHHDITKKYAVLVKYPTIGGIFSYFHGQNKYKIKFLYILVFALKS